MSIAFTEDQYDALREISNIAMGRASRALATLLDVFVHLSVPEIKVVAAAEVDSHLFGKGGLEGGVAAVRQSFYGGLSGEVISLHSRANAGDIFRVYAGPTAPSDRDSEREFLLDISNLISGAFLSGIGEQLGVELGFSAPSLIGTSIKPHEIAIAWDASWNHALFSRVQFRLDQDEFSSRVLIFLPDGSFATIRSAVDSFLERY